MGKRGTVEDVTTRVSGVLKSSELLTTAGVPHVTMVLHPTEGLIFSGEAKITRQVMDLVHKQGLESKMKEDSMWHGGSLNHMSTRKEKELLLSRLYECKIPPMPMPFSDLRITSLPLLQAQFGKVLEAELTGVKYKLGDPLPPNHLWAGDLRVHQCDAVWTNELYIGLHRIVILSQSFSHQRH